jgi:hypothetical protein
MPSMLILAALSATILFRKKYPIHSQKRVERSFQST